jgi:hypothetical protein
MSHVSEKEFDKLWSRTQSLFAGIFLSDLFIELFVEPFKHVRNTPVELIIILYFGVILMTVFWNNV